MDLPPPPVSAVVGEGGRLVIPADMRKLMGIKPGDTVALRLEDGSLRVISSKMALEAIRAQARRVKGGSEVDDFLAERRKEAKRDDERFDRLEREAADVAASKRKR
jgi:AbrB family looped-hinge helix DNA binding protein